MGISFVQAALILKATTQKLVWLAIVPLSCRYQADRIFNVKRLQCTITTDNMHARVKSIHGDYYCQVFGNKEFFIESYPMEKKSDCHESLDNFLARLDHIRWITRTGRARHKIPRQLYKIWYPWAYIIKGTFQPEPSRSRYSGTVKKLYR